jgi:hypothetical protein
MAANNNFGNALTQAQSDIVTAQSSATTALLSWNALSVSLLQHKEHGFGIGEVSMRDNNTATTISNINTWTVCNPGSSLEQLGGEDAGTWWTLNSDSGTRVGAKHVGSTYTTLCHLGCTFSFLTANNNVNLQFAIVVNPTFNVNEELTSANELDNSIIHLTAKTAGHWNSSAIHCMTSLSQNDVVYLLVRNDSSATTITICDVNLFGVRMWPGS